MTSGSETGHIIRFALPLLGGNLLQQTYNIADTLIVGRVLGDDALAAVGATGSITYLFYTLCIGLSIGAGVMIAQLFGAGDIKRMRSAVFNSAVVTAIFGLVISIVGVIAARSVLTMLNVPAKLIDDSSAYMRIACGGTLAVAAWATVLAQGFSAAACILYSFGRNESLRLSRSDIKADRDMMARCVSMGVPIALQNGLISVSMVALQRVTNGFGETVMAAYTVSMRIEQFVQQPFSSLNAAVSTFTGQNIGAGKEERAVRGLRSALTISVIFAFAVLVLFAAFGRYIAGWFVTGSEVISIASKAVVITAAFYWSLGAIHTTRGFLNGTGDTGYALVNGLAEVICRIGLSLVLTKIPSIGCWGIWLTTCFTWFATAAVSIIRYKSGKWKNRSVVRS